MTSKSDSVLNKEEEAVVMKDSDNLVSGDVSANNVEQKPTLSDGLKSYIVAGDNRVAGGKASNEKIVSIAIAHQRLSRSVDEAEFIEYHQKIINPDYTVYGSADDFHNLTAEYARKDFELWAFDILIRAINIFPLSIIFLYKDI